uniref:Methyltransferase n=1 Tax=Tanacetum cinerariifolium TaxID=118510 RepID=A0A6L2KW18_TANCI|nr:probable pectin methyltransferase QUA2 [Tanacetum cinerariifolium]
MESVTLGIWLMLTWQEPDVEKHVCILDCTHGKDYKNAVVLIVLEAGKSVWVMNVVPTSWPNHVPLILDTWFLGVLHDWCEPFLTYPRTYNLVHAECLLSLETVKQLRCSMLDVFFEAIITRRGWSEIASLPTWFQHCPKKSMVRMVNAGAWWWWWSANCYYMSDSDGNHYGSSSRLNTSRNKCRGVGHTSMNCPNVVNASGQRVNNMATGGAQNNGLSNVTSAYVGGNAAQGRYGSASEQYQIVFHYGLTLSKFAIRCPDLGAGASVTQRGYQKDFLSCRRIENVPISKPKVPDGLV